jgi:hypothetical protein
MIEGEQAIYCGRDGGDAVHVAARGIAAERIEQIRNGE